MNTVDSIMPNVFATAPTSSVVQSLDPRGFERTLAGVEQAQGREAQARAAAQDLVSIALVQPALKMMRDSSAAAPPFAPGDAEKAFGAFFDAEISRSVAGAGATPLIDAVARRLMSRLDAEASAVARSEVDVDA